jgi:hypothetical protein
MYAARTHTRSMSFILLKSCRRSNASPPGLSCTGLCCGRCVTQGAEVRPNGDQNQSAKQRLTNSTTATPLDSNSLCMIRFHHDSSHAFPMTRCCRCAVCCQFTCVRSVVKLPVPHLSLLRSARWVCRRRRSRMISQRPPCPSKASASPSNSQCRTEWPQSDAADAHSAHRHLTAEPPTRSRPSYTGSCSSSHS